MATDGNWLFYGEPVYDKNEPSAGDGTSITTQQLPVSDQYYEDEGSDGTFQEVYNG